MIPALLAQFGLPFLAKLVGGALGKIDNPIAKTASEALGAFGDAVQSKEISPEQIAEANRHVEAMAKTDSDELRDVIKTVNETMRAEANSQDEYVRRWRPYWGYVSAKAWMFQVAVTCLAVLSACGLLFTGKGELAQILFEGVAKLAESLSPMWIVALSMVGVAQYVRSREKNGGGAQAGPSLLGSIAQRIAGGSSKGKT